MGKSYEEEFVSSLASALKQKREERGRIDDPHYWPQFFQESLSKSAQNVTPDTSLRFSTVLACVRVLGETAATLPLKFYKRLQEGGKVEATNKNLYRILHDQPNPLQTSFEFIEMLVTHVALRGNFYAFQERTRDGEIHNIYPLNPVNMAIKQIQDEDDPTRIRLIYEYTMPNGGIEKWPQELIWHVRWLTNDGIIGLSPITLAREAIGFGMATHEHGSRFFSNYAQTGLVLKYPGKLTSDASKGLRENVENSFARSNAFKTMVLEGGLDVASYVPMTMKDAEFIQTMNFSIEEIARIFRVPLALIQHSDRATSYSSVEQFFLSFMIHTMQPWLKRIEQSISRCLLSDFERERYFAEFSVQGFLKGDHASRAQFYKELFNIGVLSPDDIRNLENLNSIPDGLGKKYFISNQIRELGNNPVIEKEPINANTKTE